MIRLPKWVLVVLALALVFGLTAPACAASKIKAVTPDTKQFVATDKEGKDTTYKLADNARIITPSDPNAKLSDLKTGQEVTIAYEKRGDEYLANGVLLHEGAFKNDELIGGTIKSRNNDRSEFVLRDPNGKEWTFQLGDTAKVRLNDKDSKFVDLKDNDHVLITYHKQGDKNMVTNLFADRR